MIDKRKRNTDINSYLAWRQNGKIELKIRKKVEKKVYEVKGTMVLEKEEKMMIKGNNH